MNRRVEELFHEVADLAAEERARYFSAHDVDDATRREVEALLHFDSGASAFLDRDIRIAATRALPQIEATASLCGPYRLRQVIGRGGMGAVYLAERADGEVTQQVAVKLLPLGAGDPLRERFLQERQILAALAHPNIARMLDAGRTDNGQPFLAMEYVEGRPIDVFAAGLPVRQKVALFLKVCAAVAYLHRNLVVHRDLKPSNILVTAEGEPKLLDFGIAKLLDVATDSTVTSLRMMTPDYASPEQVMGGAVTTATDVYSLGAVLYRLLTEKPAHEFGETSPEAIARTVTRREVTRPAKWAPELKGDLESILMKALRKDPRERYATVEQYAEDLEAFLTSRPVKARSGNAWYRTRKFLRRYWIPVTAAALVTASLGAGLYIADRQRRSAERRFSQLRQLAHQVLFELEPEIGGIPTAINARKKLLATSTQYLAGLSADAIHDKELALEVAESYMQVARIQGVSSWNNLGQYAEAEESLRKADVFLESVLAADPDNRNALWLSANVAHDRASAAASQRRQEQVIAAGWKTRRQFDHLVRLGNLTRKEINGATYIYASLAGSYIDLHRFADAAAFARAGIDISRTISTVAGPRAQAFTDLAGALTCMGDFPGAAESLREARNQEELYRHGERYNRHYGQVLLASVRYQEGLTLGEDGGVNLDRPREAAAAFREAFDALDEWVKADSKDYQARADLAEVGNSLGDVLRHSDPKRALEIYDYSLMRVREVPKADVAARRWEARLLAGSSYAARWLHQANDARARIDAAFRLLRDTKDYPVEIIKPGSEADLAVRALADHYAETGEPTTAIETYQELLRKILASNPDPRNDLVNAAHLSRLDASLGALLGRAGRPDEAAALGENRLVLWRAWERKLPANPFVERQIAASAAR